MPLRSLDISIISANNLETVSPDAELFVTASLISGFGYQSQTFNTSSTLAVNNFAGSTAEWNFPLSFEIDDQLDQAELQLNLFQISLDLHYSLHLQTIGEATVPIRRLLESDSNSGLFVDYPICDDCGTTVGEFEFSFILSDGEEGEELPNQAPRPLPRRIGGFLVPSRWVVVLILMLMSGQVQEILAKIWDLVIDAISLVIAGFVFVGFLAFLPDMLKWIYVYGLNKMECAPEGPGI